MGAGVSIARLRKAIVIRAFNLRDKDQTLEEQFEKYTFSKTQENEENNEEEVDHRVYISLDDVRMAMNDNGKLKWVDDLFRQLLGASSPIDMEFKDFIDFLETGKSPSIVHKGTNNNDNDNENILVPSSTSSLSLSSSLSLTLLPKVSKKKKALQLAKNRDNAANNDSDNNHDHGDNSSDQLSVFPGKTVTNNGEVPIINLSTSSSAPSLSALMERNKQEEHQKKRQQQNQLPNPPVVPLTSLHQSPTSSSSSPSSSSTNNKGEGIHPDFIRFDINNDHALIVTKGSDSSVVPPKPLWRKREVVRQEKSTYYTTVDGDGITQELMEKETTQTEILHMECKETGEFAHRETTNHELLEKFNDEVVTHDTGKEEYVHLKSVDDEIEYMDSNMPRADEAAKEGSGEEDGEYPPHSNDNNDATAAATATATAGDEEEEKAKYVEKLDVDEADVEEEMRRQWDLLSDEEKAYYEEALLQMEREKHKNGDEECSFQQDNQKEAPEASSPSSLAPSMDMDMDDNDLIDEEQDRDNDHTHTAATHTYTHTHTHENNQHSNDDYNNVYSSEVKDGDVEDNANFADID